ncbi:MAG: hypothetical protein IPI06_05690 [Gammaproteobacteria bacterium]|nr:hypothetical protein [Gammaproteobacteria bacterium]
MSMPADATKHDARGQALVEFLVATGTLTALLAGTMLLGAYDDLQWTTIQASRYVAFEHAVGAPDGDVAVERATRARFFTRASSPLRSQDARETRQDGMQVNPLWHDLSGQRRLLASPQHVEVVAENQAPPGLAGHTTQVLFPALRSASLAAPGELDLTERGLVVGRVSVRAVDFTAMAMPVPAPGTPALLLRERTTLFSEDWHAAGPAHAAERVASLAVGAWLGELRALLRPGRAAATLFEPRFAQLCLGRIDPEIVPPDRLLTDVTAGQGQWRAPC